MILMIFLRSWVQRSRSQPTVYRKCTSGGYIPINIEDGLVLLYISVEGDDTVTNSDDLRHVLLAIGEANLTETLALQEAIMQSQMSTATTSGICYCVFVNRYLL